MTGNSLVINSGSLDADSSIFDAISQHYLFAGLEQSVVADLAVQTHQVTLGKGEVLFDRGDFAAYFYYLHTGLVELNLLSGTGEKKTLEVIGADRTFGKAIAFMQQRKFPVTAEALSDSTLCQIPIDAYIDIVYSDRDACMRLLGDVCRHLHARVREIETLTVQNAHDRLASYLLDHIVESNDDEATVLLDLPRHVVASRLSIKPETLSRLLRSMSDEGILTIDDRLIVVHSLARLRPYD